MRKLLVLFLKGGKLLFEGVGILFKEGERVVLFFKLSISKISLTSFFFKTFL
jgi:hypothetical protein